MKHHPFSFPVQIGIRTDQTGINLYSGGRFKKKKNVVNLFHVLSLYFFLVQPDPQELQSDHDDAEGQSDGHEDLSRR